MEKRTVGKQHIRQLSMKVFEPEASTFDEVKKLEKVKTDSDVVRFLANFWKKYHKLLEQLERKEITDEKFQQELLKLQKDNHKDLAFRLNDMADLLQELVNKNGK
ncbi:MAG TPA: hypothetical protein VM577_05790 [Anaerovoracaceae bacterium]|nr:hypothetical protein [Anaerovoracaceae bacterium]